MNREDNERNNQEQQFLDSIKTELDKSVDDINAGDLSAIMRVRHRALDRTVDKKPNWIFIPAGAFATLCFAVIVYSFMQMTPDMQIQNQTNNIEQQVTDSGTTEAENVDTLPLIDAFVVYGVLNVDADVYEQIEFYEWLDMYEPSGDLSGQG